MFIRLSLILRDIVSINLHYNNYIRSYAIFFFINYLQTFWGFPFLLGADHKLRHTARGGRASQICDKM